MTDLGRMHNMHDRDDLLAEQVCVCVCVRVRVCVVCVCNSNCICITCIYLCCLCIVCVHACVLNEPLNLLFAFSITYTSGLF